MLEFSCDREADAVYIRLTWASYSHGKDLDPERRVDYDLAEAPVGVELRCVSNGVNLGGLPAKRSIRALLMAQGIKILP